MYDNEKNQADPSYKAAGQTAEYENSPPAWGNQMGESSLALRLQSPRLGVGTRSLEQVNRRETRSGTKSGFFKSALNRTREAEPSTILRKQD